jgi:hypothetical protein
MSNITDKSIEPMNRFSKNRTSSNHAHKHQQAIDVNNKIPVQLDISKPFEFKLITHVEYDKKTRTYIGLPPEWKKKLEGDYFFKNEKQQSHQPTTTSTLQNQNTNVHEQQKKQQQQPSHPACISEK